MPQITALAAARLKLEELQRKRGRVLSNSLELGLSSEEVEVVRAKLGMLRQHIVVAEAETGVAGSSAVFTLRTDGVS